MKTMSLLSACKDFFGLKPGQGALQFYNQEFKALSVDDKAYFKLHLEASGLYKIVEDDNKKAEAKVAEAA